MTWHVRVIANRYADSVRLMGVAGDVRALDGVERCELAMGTPANLEALAALGAEAKASPGDVVIAVQVGDEHAAAEALDAAERGLQADEGAPHAPGAGETPPRSLSAAARRLNGANVALVSVPGAYAALVAHQALSRGLHVFLFSDHVDVADEVALKRRGVQRDRLVMGPECGTAMLGGVGLGFANVVRRGPVGIVAAAGTGAQEAACLLDAAGVGVSHIVGVGGRDLSREIGGVMFRAGMQLLAGDDETDALLLVSKPPDREVVRGLAGELPADKRVVAAFVGGDGAAAPFEVHPTLEAGVCALAGAPPPRVAELEQAVDRARGRSAGRAVLGLFSGGTLAREAASILGPGHRVLDLGAEEYTRGRPHPMVDLGTRVRMLDDAAGDDAIGCVLLDVVLGHGAHPDPASELAEPIARLAGSKTVIARVCGTRADPQDADRQTAALRDAGALVAPSNAAAARLAARAVAGSAV